MRVYGGVDLHANRSVIVVKDEKGKRVFCKRVNNDLELIQQCLEPYRDSLVGVAVESTFNWYWLVDGLMDAGFKVHLANPAAMKQYQGLKYADDVSDADWIAEMLRLGILPEGYIYPKEDRAVRDLLRRRSRLVRQRTANIVSVLGIMSNNTGRRPKTNEVKAWTDADIDELFANEHLALATRANVEVIRCLTKQIETFEKAVLSRARLRSEYEVLLTINGVGEILALTIMYETGDIGRFSSVGNYASYCRLVDSKWMTDDKRKGSGNTRCGNAYLHWAFIEAAHFAVRFNPTIERFHQRKVAKRKKKMVATGAVAHKLARASYHMLKKQEGFNVESAFA
jgi:transposase